MRQVGETAFVSNFGQNRRRLLANTIMLLGQRIAGLPIVHWLKIGTCGSCEPLRRRPPDRNRKIGVVQWPSRMPPNPQKEFAVTQVAKVRRTGFGLVPKEAKQEASGRHFRAHHVDCLWRQYHGMDRWNRNSRADELSNHAEWPEPRHTWRTHGPGARRQFGPHRPAWRRRA
jgi:hypothetical protein